MSSVSPADIEHIAGLSRLALTDQEKHMYAEQLSVIFEYVDMLSSVDTSGAEETCQVTRLEDVTREDFVHEIDDETRRALMAAFPEACGDLLQVRAVFQEQSNL